MSELSQKNDDDCVQFNSGATSSNESVSVNEFWSKDVSFNQLQKFWKELSLQARSEILRVDKQTLLARKNMSCSRCNGLLLEEFLQIVKYGKYFQQEGAVGHYCNGLGISKTQDVGSLSDDVHDPSIHPWGGLTTNRDGTITLLECYLLSTSLKGIQNVFDAARARERERKLLYPNACGGGGHKWIYYGTKETCALHKAQLSVETLVDFWSSLGEESRRAPLRMKEEDFIEQLIYRFDKKKFCKDCRKNVIREFKELKELKRVRREPRCNSSSCVPDTSFQYEISHDTVQADWSHTFIDTHGIYHHYEWAIGSGEGKSDILAFKDVGLSGKVHVNGLDISGFDEFYITLRAWKMDGNCNEYTVKAHALYGQQCIHRRLVVCDGFVTITEGESMRNFLEHAEEVIEEEDDDLLDKDGNRLDGDCSRSQRHAKSPELARKFLLDAATVIFKEQVDKAFRRETARHNAHSLFVSLALRLLEERLHVACKEILTLEKQMKLLEEEAKVKRAEEERKEWRRMKEREKKLRRKEKAREKEKDRDNYVLPNQHLTPEAKIVKAKILDEEPDATCNKSLITSEPDRVMSSRPVTPHIQDKQRPNGCPSKIMHNLSDDSPDEIFATSKDKNGASGSDNVKCSRRKLKNRYQQDTNLKCSDKGQYEVESGSGVMVGKSEQSYHVDLFDGSSRTTCRLNKQSRSNAAKSYIRTGAPKLFDKLHCSSERRDLHAHSCCQPHSASLKMSSPSYCGNKFTLGDYIQDGCERSKLNCVAGNNPSIRDSPQSKKVWEPMESQMKHVQNCSESNVAERSSTLSGDAKEPLKPLESHGALCYEVVCQMATGIKDEDDVKKEIKSCKPQTENNFYGGFHLEEETCQYFKEPVNAEVEMCSSLIEAKDPPINNISSSDSCSSCLSEGDNSRSTSNPHIIDSSPCSVSEDASQQSEGTEISKNLQIGFLKFEEFVIDDKQTTNEGEHFRSCSFDSRRIYAPAKVPKESGNGLVPLRHPNHCSYARSIKHGLDEYSHSMQYSSVQHLASPLVNHAQVQAYHPIVQANDIHLKQHTVVSDLVEVKESGNHTNAYRYIPRKQYPTQTQLNAAGKSNRSSDKSQTENKGFSLFHSGGPFALVDAHKSDHWPSINAVGDIFSINSIHHNKGNAMCNPKDSVIEYNLFESCKGITFSIF